MDNKGLKKLLFDRMKDVLDSMFSYPYRNTEEGRNGIVLAFRKAISFSDIIYYGGSVYIFNGKYYSVLNQNDFRGVVEDLCEGYGVLSGFWGTVWKMSYSKATDLTVSPNEVRRSVLCFENGIIDFSSSDIVLQPHNAKYYVFYQLPYAYDPKAGRVLFDRFLKRVVPERQMRDNLQELCGCIFLDRDRHRIEKMGILWGTGANGKSTFAEILTGVVGEENVSHFDLKDLTVSGDKEKNIKHIEGKLLNYCTEITSKSINNPNIKSLISREPQMARAIYQPPQTVYDIPMLFGNVNQLPMLNNSYKAFLRRIMIYPFDVEISKKDMDLSLSEKIKPEYSGILNWIMEGLHRFVANGYVFTRSPKMENALLELDKGAPEDPIMAFLTEGGYLPNPIENDDEGFLIGIGEIMLRFTRWVEYHGYDLKQNNFTLGKRLTSLGYCKKRASDGSGAMLYAVFGNIKEF